MAGREVVEEGVNRVLSQIASLALLGTIQHDREAARRLIYDAERKYAPMLARLKTSELVGLTNALLAETVRRGGDEFSSRAFEQVVREVVEAQ